MGAVALPLATEHTRSMPIYEYQCVDCGERVERLQSVNDPPPAACEQCGGAMTRVLSVPAFQFKGTGWYVTDYAGRKKPDEGGESSGSGDAGDKGAAKGDSGAKDATGKSEPAKKTAASPPAKGDG